MGMALEWRRNHNVYCATPAAAITIFRDLNDAGKGRWFHLPPSPCFIGSIGSISANIEEGRAREECWLECHRSSHVPFLKTKVGTGNSIGPYSK
jgi:hypothetical protein